mmetsp:Transcript_97732/g.254718  ORF Transcript_97732/g.254718 Transcript_97732/m.254718 type:complete len:231 (-) Transcript_97732:44-736(-)
MDSVRGCSKCGDWKMRTFVNKYNPPISHIYKSTLSSTCVLVSLCAKEARTTGMLPIRPTNSTAPIKAPVPPPFFFRHFKLLLLPPSGLSKFHRLPVYSSSASTCTSGLATTPPGMPPRLLPVIRRRCSRPPPAARRARTLISLADKSAAFPPSSTHAPGRVRRGDPSTRAPRTEAHPRWRMPAEDRMANVDCCSVQSSETNSSGVGGDALSALAMPIWFGAARRASVQLQ